MTTLPNLRAEDVLSATELHALTGKARPGTQAAALVRLGLPFTFNGRTIKVQRTVAEAHEVLPQQLHSSGLRWDRIRK